MYAGGFPPNDVSAPLMHNSTVLLNPTTRPNRYLLHPTEGLGITDEVVRRQILDAVDSLKVDL